MPKCFVLIKVNAPRRACILIQAPQQGIFLHAKMLRFDKSERSPPRLGLLTQRRFGG
jgi:hypothetical protein